MTNLDSKTVLFGWKVHVSLQSKVNGNCITRYAVQTLGKQRNKLCMGQSSKTDSCVARTYRNTQFSVPWLASSDCSGLTPRGLERFVGKMLLLRNFPWQTPTDKLSLVEEASNQGSWDSAGSCSLRTVTSLPKLTSLFTEKHYQEFSPTAGTVAC